MWRSAVVGIVVAMGVAGCAGNPASGGGSTHVYSSDQTARLGLCLAMNDTAMAVILSRRSGKTKEQIMAYYQQALGENEKLLNLTKAIVDRTYEANPEKIYDYLDREFQACAVHFAKVEPLQTSSAHYCLKQYQIASLALSYRNNKRSTEELYQTVKLTPKNEAEVRKVVEAVYANPSSQRGQVLTPHWNDCIKRFEK